jgi:RNase P subunit RPR2
LEVLEVYAMDDATRILCKKCQDTLRAEQFRRGVERGQVLMMCPSCGHQWYLDGMDVTEIQMSDEELKSLWEGR